MKQPVRNKLLERIYGQNIHLNTKGHFNVHVKIVIEDSRLKANLLKHIETYHNIKIPNHNKKILAFEIVSINKNTQRTRTYNDNKFILVEKLPENITLIDFYYDIYSKTISVKSYTREYLKKIYQTSTIY